MNGITWQAVGELSGDFDRRRSGGKLIVCSRCTDVVISTKVKQKKICRRNVEAGERSERASSIQEGTANGLGYGKPRNRR